MRLHFRQSPQKEERATSWSVHLLAPTLAAYAANLWGTINNACWLERSAHSHGKDIGSNAVEKRSKSMRCQSPAGDPADVDHRLPIEEAGNEAKAFIHNGAFFPRHRHPQLFKVREKCHPCLRNEMSPMSQVGQKAAGFLIHLTTPPSPDPSSPTRPPQE